MAKPPCCWVSPRAWAALRERITKPITIITASANRPNMSIWPKASPRPSELASQARPKPAAKPPSIAPQGRLGAAAAAPAAAGAAAAPCAGPAGARAVSRWVTLFDCCPTDLPPPMRLEASAFTLMKVIMTTSTIDQSFISSPSLASSQNGYLSTLDSNMQCHYPARQAVVIHMAESAFFHQGF